MPSACRAIILVHLLLINALSASADTIRVPAEQPTIQAGIDAAAPGDIVLVAPGTYTGPGNKILDFRGKEIVLRSEGGRDATVIDCQNHGTGFWFHSNETGGAVVEGFTVRNGSLIPPGDRGAGMHIDAAAPSIRHCAFESNRAGSGGGAFLHDSDSILHDCLFIDNHALSGGGLMIQGGDPTLRQCVVEENSSEGGGGGGIAAEDWSTPTLDDCIIRNNSGGSQGSTGGGLSAYGSGLVVMDCLIEGNLANQGAGIGAVGGLVLILRSTITGNHAFAELGPGPGSGGGLWARDCEVDVIDSTLEGNLASNFGTGGIGGGIATVESILTVDGCLFTGNHVAEFTGAPPTGEGGAIGSLGYQLAIVGSTFFRNSAGRGGAVRYDALAVQVDGCTFVENTATLGAALSLGGTSVALVDKTIIAFGTSGAAVDCEAGTRAAFSCSDVFGNIGGDWVGCLAGQQGTDGNFSLDPLLCDRASGDFTLAGDSPCLPGHHPQGAPCGLIGAHEEGCPTVAVDAASWGAIKARYRR